jgi:hypothetical protein
VTVPPGAPAVPVSWGELLDKLTILEIKLERVGAPEARANVEREERLLRRIAEPVLDGAEVAALVRRLREINQALWEIEDAIRVKERERDFGPGFIELARSVYSTNDERAAVKRKLNAVLRSDLVEEKSYAEAGIFFQGAAVLAGVHGVARIGDER